VEQLLLLGIVVMLVTAVVVGLVSRGLGTKSRQAPPAKPKVAPKADQPKAPPTAAAPDTKTLGPPAGAPPLSPAGPASGPPDAVPDEADVDDALSDFGAEDMLTPALDVPEPSKGRLRRLRSRLARSQTALGRGLLVLLSRDVLDEDTWEEIEETLLAADVGVAPTQELVERLRTEVRVQGARTPDQLRELLRSELLRLIGTDVDRSLHPQRRTGERPSVVLVVGVNGTGKTTTTGKLARVLIGDGQTVLLGAADTFRAAAADQLQTWGDRVGARTVRGPEGGDPASIAFDAVKEGAGQDVDCVLIDTAGRLHTKTGLMDELGKVKRVIEKQSPVHEVLLVLDATTGQNGLMQARVFAEVVDVTGIVLSKLDGTAKGGIVIAVQRELGVPVKLVGLGEGADDLAPFEPEAFVDALLSD
jgi:fused signal recognition particle receptor